MEKLVHNIFLSVFVKPEDNYDEIKSGFLKLVGIILEKKGKDILEIKEENTKGFNDRIIKIISCKIDKDKYVKKWIKNMLNNLTKEQKDMLINQKESRLDDDLFFFIRLDKKKFLSGNWWITEEGDCYHIKLHIAAYPAKKEKGMHIIDKIFKELKKEKE